MSWSQKLYIAPTNYTEHFVYLGRRYYLTADKALISDYGKYGMCPPMGRGFYVAISKKEFKEAQLGYQLQKINWQKALSGYLNNGVEKLQPSLL